MKNEKKITFCIDKWDQRGYDNHVRTNYKGVGAKSICALFYY